MTHLHGSQHSVDKNTPPPQHQTTITINEKDIENDYEVEEPLDTSTTADNDTQNPTSSNNNEAQQDTAVAENNDPHQNHHHHHHHHEDLKASIAAITGNILEWYDFSIFGYFSDIIGEVFFPPNQSGSKSLVESFAVFGAAFLVRPIGGIIIGFMGDTIGRKSALETSIFLMAAPTFVLGCLPSFEQASWGSTTLLLIVRLIQGFSVGGQLTSTVVYTMERSDESKWGVWGASVFAVANVGTALGSFFSYLLRQTLSEKDLKKWGWRIPFWFGIFGAVPGLYLKYHAKEHGVPVTMATATEEEGRPLSTPLLQEEDDDDGNDNDEPQQQQQQPPPQTNENNNNNNNNALQQSFSKSNIRALLSVMLLCALPASSYYIVSVWLAIFMEKLANPPIPHAFAITTANNIIGIPFQLLSGWIADCWGNYVGMMVFASIMFAWMAPLLLYYIGKDGTVIIAIFGQGVLVLVQALFNAGRMPWIVKAFPPSMRLTSVSFAYNLSTSIFGGFAPAVATALTSKYGSTAPGYMITVLCGMALLGLLIAPKKKTGGNYGEEIIRENNSTTAANVSSDSLLENEINNGASVVDDDTSSHRLTEPLLT